MANWQLDPTHTQAGFSAKHMMVTTVRGTFENISGTLEFDSANPAASSVDVQIDARTIATGFADRDNHLRSADFLDVENHPYITFKSTKFTPKGDEAGVLTGDLTIRGTTRSVDIQVSYLGENKNPWGKTVAGFEGETKINREDFGLTWNVALETGGILVGKEIKISLDVEAVLIEEAVAAAAQA